MAKKSKSSGVGCSSIVYYVFIWWWWIPIKWLMILFWRLLVWSFEKIKILFNKLSEFISTHFNQPKNIGRLIVILLILVICGLCCLTSYVYSLTPQAKASVLAREQTLTANPTRTFRPSTTTKPSNTPWPSNTPKATSTITQTKNPTSTKTPLPPTVTLDPNRPCDCWVNYDCKDFSYQSEAQKCFDYCGGSKSYNFAYLDGSDRDGRVCENLP